MEATLSAVKTATFPKECRKLRHRFWPMKIIVPGAVNREKRKTPLDPGAPIDADAVDLMAQSRCKKNCCAKTDKTNAQQCHSGLVEGRRLRKLRKNKQSKEAVQTCDDGSFSTPLTPTPQRRAMKDELSSDGHDCSNALVPVDLFKLVNSGKGLGVIT